MKIQKGIIASLLSLSLCGCASIVSHSNWPVSLNSNPAGADIVVTDMEGHDVVTGKTPLSVKLKSGDGYFKAATYNVAVKMDGYAPVHQKIVAHLNAWYFGNVLLGGMIGIVFVDPATGAMYRLPAQYSVNLTKAVASAGATHQELKVVSVDTISPEIKAKLIPLK